MLPLPRPAGGGALTVHTLPSDPALRHGSFSASRPPVVTVDPGDTVVLSCLDAGWHALEQERPLRHDALRRVARSVDASVGHCLVGPIAVRGARAGQTLRVHIDEVVPTDWAWGAAGGWSTPLNDALGLGPGAEEARIVWEIADGVARNEHGDAVPLRPFPGVIGMPPPGPGTHSTIPPRRWGGNLDCRELVAGSFVELPIPVDGALLSVGDGHGAQGDGEVSGIAVECGLRRLALRLDVLPYALHMPRASTPAGLLTFGVAATLDEAVALAVDGMLRWLGERHGIARARALALASVAVDLRVTQAVNGVVGAHALLAPGRLTVGE